MQLAALGLCKLARRTVRGVAARAVSGQRWYALSGCPRCHGPGDPRGVAAHVVDAGVRRLAHGGCALARPPGLGFIPPSHRSSLVPYNRPVIAALVAPLHVLALAIGLPAVVLRGRALKAPLDAAGFRRLFAADTAWGLAALLWIATGLLRAFGGLDKGAQFYLNSRLFWVKLALFALVLALEIWPMATFIRWRVQLRRGQAPDSSRARVLYVLNHLEMGVEGAIVFLASFMATGFGLRSTHDGGYES